MLLLTKGFEKWSKTPALWNLFYVASLMIHLKASSSAGLMNELWRYNTVYRILLLQKTWQEHPFSGDQCHINHDAYAKQISPPPNH
ncbi:hypothetical protein FB192DRAFT_1398319 [Mucor lusitanicus]|uniref:Uncharacterized protein n=1 Tax=Mucor circinelloides f. lusitanicus TaxID=29924 RepID=A0A8H4EXK4_MUCCL|nr:hypothetical protein FB192DRAFT_1398319 [Mucor lusitanicus]